MVGRRISPWELKKLEQARKPVLEALVCPNCKAPLSMRAVGTTTTLACSSCGSVLDVSVSPDQTGTALVVAEEAKKKKVKPVLPLGARCKLHGATWEVIGFMVRSNEPSITEDQYQWSEYLLFNPYKGYRWLVEDDGHWQYFVPLHEIPKADTFRKTLFGVETIDYSGHPYSLTSTMDTRVECILGEFYWRVRYADKTEISEYQDEPYTLTKEQTADEVNWSFGEILTKHNLLEAFKDDPSFQTINNNMPQASDKEEPTFFDQIFPNLHLVEWPIYGIGAFLFVMLMVFHVITGNMYPEKEVFQATYNAPYGDTLRTGSMDQVSSDFEITSTYGGLGLSVTALDLDNEWLSFEGELVNQETGEIESFDMGLEFYSGYDSDGRWTEGSKRENLPLQSVSPGKYKLITHTELSPRPTRSKPLTYQVKLTQNHQPAGTFWFIAFLLLLLPGGILLLRILNFCAALIAADTDDW